MIPDGTPRLGRRWIASLHPRARTITRTEWGVAWPSPHSRSGWIWNMLPYDNEDDARAHLGLHGPDAFLVARNVTATLWGRIADERAEERAER